MKEYRFELDARQVGQFFSPIRAKEDVIKLLMRSIKLMLIQQELPEELKVGNMVLVVEKCSRLFYFDKGKYFSVAFPFTAIEEDGQFRFTSKEFGSVDSKVTSDVIGLLADRAKFETECPLTFIEPILELEESGASFWSLVRSLFLMEDGYLRYDFDKERENVELHPLNHYDIFYSGYATFKLGLRDELQPESMIDMLQVNTACHYLEAK